MKVVAIIPSDNLCLPIILDGNYTIKQEMGKDKISYTLKKKEKFAMLESFYHKNLLSLTAIVGKNGVGKTTLLNQIFNGLYNRESQYIAYQIIENNNKLSYIKSESINGEPVELNMVSGAQGKVIKVAEHKEGVNNHNIIYSSALETSNNMGNDQINLTTTSLLMENDYRTLLRDDMLKQVSYLIETQEFFSDSESEIKNDLIEWDKKFIKLCLSQTGNSIYDLRQLFIFGRKLTETNFNDFISKKVTTPEKQKEEKQNKNTKLKYNKVLVLKYFGVLISLLQEDHWNILYQELKDVNNEKKVVDLIQLEENIFNFLKKQDECAKYKQKLLELKRVFSNLLTINEYEIINNFDVMNKNHLDVVNKIIKMIYDKNSYIVDLVSIFTFEWNGLSSGELNMLNLYGRLHAAYKKKIEKSSQNNTDPITIVIDEADLGFHPNWQRRWLDKFLSQIDMVLGDRKFQLIISTHAPLILSDVLDKDIIYLPKKNIIEKRNIKTFGQNIHTLYSDNFYLSHTIGKVSMAVINKLINLLSMNYVANLESVANLIKSDQSQKCNDLLSEKIYRLELTARESKFSSMLVQLCEMANELYLKNKELNLADQEKFKIKADDLETLIEEFKKFGQFQRDEFVDEFVDKFEICGFTESKLDLVDIFSYIEILAGFIGEDIYRSTIGRMINNCKEKILEERIKEIDRNKEIELLKARLAELEGEFDND